MIKIEITANEPAEVQAWARMLVGLEVGEIADTVTLTPAGAKATADAVTNPHGFGVSEDGTRKGRGTGRKKGEEKLPQTEEATNAEIASAVGAADEPEAPKEGEVLPPENAVAITPDDLRAEMKRISADHGIDATRKLLARMGVAKLGDVEVAKYPEFMALAKTWTGASA